MLFSVHYGVYFIPVIAAQYALALFALSKLARINPSIKKYIIWNLIILFAFFIGPAAFLFYYFKNKNKLIAAEPAPQTEQNRSLAEQADIDAENVKNIDETPNIP